MGDDSFTYAAPNLWWNTIPLAIRSVNTVTGFLRQTEYLDFAKPKSGTPGPCCSKPDDASLW